MDEDFSQKLDAKRGKLRQNGTHAEKRQAPHGTNS